MNLLQSGTREGALKGWETRRRGFHGSSLESLYNKYTSEQQFTIDAWSDPDSTLYASMNRYLRDPKKFNENSERYAKELDKLFIPSPYNATVYRATERPMELKVGDTFTDKGYVSTSLDEEFVARTFGYGLGGRQAKRFSLYRLNLKKGTKIIPISNRGESEILLSRGTKFKVTGVSEKKFTAQFTDTLANPDRTSIDVIHTAVVYDLEIIK